MKSISKSLMIMALAISICLPAMVAGQAQEHEGFFMRFLAGAGPGNIVLEDVSGSDATFKSIGGAFHFQIGTNISENLILFGDLGGFSLIDPEMEWQGQSGTVEDVSVSAMGFGAGATYYMMPANFYLSGSVMYVSDTIEFSGSKGESEYGIGFFACIGKEWWVGDNWGLGAALFFEYSAPKDKEDPSGNQAQIKNTIFGIMFSATMD